MKALLDTNILLDVLLRRQPFMSDAQQIWRTHEDGQLIGYVSATSITDVFYIGRKAVGFEDARNGVQLCLRTFEICAVDLKVLETAMALPGNDFEDNVQVACAILYGLDAIVTRDKQGFKNTNVLALSPIELLQTLQT